MTDSVISRSAACDHEQARNSNLTILWIQDVRNADIDSMARVLSPLVSQYASVHKEMLKLSFEEE